MYNNPNITYTSGKGRDFRVSAIEKIKGTDKWIKGDLKFHWKVSIIFLDNIHPKKIKLKYDYYNKLYAKEN